MVSEATATSARRIGAQGHRDAEENSARSASAVHMR